jgi:chemotaxis response regulator CheB
MRIQTRHRDDRPARPAPILEPKRIVMAHGPRENRHRPSINVLFRSAAVGFGNA